jgi:hopanoid-associated phosphorylase
VTVLAVTGLRAEARLAARARLAVVCAGGNPERTAAALRQTITPGTAGLISLGIAGGLAPTLPAGTLVVAQSIVAADGTRREADARWARAVRNCTAAIEGDIFGAHAIVASAREKWGLYKRTGALAVDLESLVVALAAEAAGLPFIALRAIADAGTRDLPAAALIPLGGEGDPDMWAVLRSVRAEPRQIPGLLQTALDAHCALQTLRRALRRGGAALSFPCLANLSDSRQNGR